MGKVTYRTEPLDYKEVTKNITEGLKKYCKKFGIKTLVLGISGGIDSSLCAALVRMTEIPLIGFSLPCSTNEECEKNTADLVGAEFCDEYHVVNIQSLYEETEKVFNSIGVEGTKVSNGNIKARIRGSFLHNIAGIKGGIVIDTDNLSEFFLGFWTIRGGDEGEFSPIGGLWKNEVYGLAQYLKENVFKGSKALEASIALIPTDGNGVAAGGDLAQIAPGKTYNDVDEILQAWVGLDNICKEDVLKKNFDYGVFTPLCQKHSKETVERVIMRSVRSEFKRKHMPFVVDIFNGYTLDGEGNIFI